MQAVTLILFVGTPADISKSLAESLSKCNCTIEYIESGEDAIRHDPKAFDLIMIDIDLPGMSGLDVAKMLRNREAIGDYTPMIALVSDAVMEKETCLSVGFNEVFVKGEQMDSERLLKWLQE